ncbi:MAG: hypothetical protein E7347_04600 [Clostridiales bacterium]|nr:hypothetical protein [Clostridiales bacterium]
MLRSIKKAYDIIKEQDNETSITVHTIRIWCKEGKVKSLNAGTKILVDMDSLLDYISMKNI